MVVAHLGSDDSGAINVPVGAEGKGLTGWDMDESDRDFGLVVATGSTLAFTSATGSRVDTTAPFEVFTGSEFITNTFAISVAPGATVAIVQFLVLSPVDSSATALVNTDAPAVADAAVLDILTNYATDGQYRTGMTQAQIDAVINF